MVYMDGEGTTNAGNAVIMNIIPWINKAKKQKTNALRFDATRCFTTICGCTTMSSMVLEVINLCIFCYLFITF